MPSPALATDENQLQVVAPDTLALSQDEAAAAGVSVHSRPPAAERGRDVSRTVATEDDLDPAKASPGAS